MRVGRTASTILSVLQWSEVSDRLPPWCFNPSGPQTSVQGPIQTNRKRCIKGADNKPYLVSSILACLNAFFGSSSQDDRAFGVLD